MADTSVQRRKTIGKQGIVLSLTLHFGLETATLRLTVRRPDKSGFCADKGLGAVPVTGRKAGAASIFGSVRKMRITLDCVGPFFSARLAGSSRLLPLQNHSLEV